MNQQPLHRNDNNERRNYFRIEDNVILRSITIDENNALAGRVPQQFSEDMRYSLMSDLQDIEHENNRYLKAIAEENTNLAAYLKSINKKIDILAAALANAQDPIPDQHNEQISLSEAGLSYHSRCEQVQDSYVALQLTLLPSYVTLILFAKIIHCSAIDNGFKIALNFVQLKNNDRQILAKHIMQLQLAAKRKHNIE